MTEIHTYRCDICGKDFNFEDDCRKHEMEHKTAGLETSIVIMNSSRKVLPLDDWERAINRAYFIFIANQEAANQLKELFDEYGYGFPAEDAQETVSYPALFAYQDDSRAYWKSLQDVENEYNELLAVKDEMEDLLL